MAERSRLVNGRFEHNLSGWTATGDAEYLASDGDDHYGVATLPTIGDTIEQDFSVSYTRTYTIHVSIKPGSTLSTGDAQVNVYDGDGTLVRTFDLSGSSGSWTENTLTIGLAPGAPYTFEVVNVDVANGIKVDDIWLWYVPYTRAELATRVDVKLGALADDRSLSTTPSGALTEGDYTYAVDAGLRSVGAVSEDTDLPDVRCLDAGSVDAALDAIEREMLERLQRDYAVQVDTTVGPHSESLSQIASSIGKMASAAAGGEAGPGRVVVRKLTRSVEDYSLGDG